MICSPINEGMQHSSTSCVCTVINSFPLLSMLVRLFTSRSLFALAIVAIIGLPSAHAADADLSVSIATPVANILKGDLISYKLTVLNSGSATATSFTLTDAVPAGLTFDSASAGCSLNGSEVTCLSGKLAVGAVRTYVIKFTTASAACGAVVTNSASVFSAADTNASNDTSNTVSTTVACPDLSIVKSAPASVAKGDILSYKISVKNNGPSVAQTFTLTDVIPAGLTFSSAVTGCTFDGSSSVTCSARLAAGTTRNFLLKFSTAPAACGAVINNTASVSSSVDPNAANDTSSTVSTTIACPDLFITKSAPVTVLKGDLLSYTVKVTNNSPLAARSFTVTDIIPAGLTFDSASTGCSATGSEVTCSAIVAAGGSRGFILKFSTASATCGSAISNTASVSAAYDPNAANDTSNTVTTTVMCQEADLSITKSGPTTIEKGAALIYSITIANAGPTVANGIAHDVIPAGLTFIPAQSSKQCKVVGSAVNCNAGNLATSKSATFTLAFATSAAACSSTIQNVATVTTKGAIDPNTANNTSSTVSTDVTCAAVLENELTIVQKAMATTDTVVKNQKNVSLLRFEAHADNEDVLTTSFIFDAAQGSLVNAQNYALWVDTDGNGTVDTILQKGVSPTSGKVTFDALAGGGYVVPATESVIFEIHVDIAASLVDDKLQLKFATTTSDYIAAERLLDGSPIGGIKTNGTCATTCEITVTTQQATVYTIHSQGELFIQKSTTPTRPRMALGGTLTDEVLRLQFHSEYEDIDVTDLVLTATGPNAGTFATNVDRIEFFKVGATTPFAIANVAGCGTTSVPANSMCATMHSQEFVIPKGSNTNILVRLRMRTDVDGSVSGQHVQLTVDAVAGAQARGLISSNTLSQNDGDGVLEGELLIGVASPAPSQTITGNDNVVVLSKVTSITNADPNANGTAIPTGFGRQIGFFKFSTAAANNTKNGTNKWTLSDIIFNVNATNVLLGTGDQTSLATSDFKIFLAADSSVKSTCTANRASASGSSLVVTCSDITSSSVNTEIDPGTDATFVLEAEVVNAKISNSSTSTLQVSLQNFTDIGATGFGPSQSHMRWLDKDFGSSTSFLWIEYPETNINGTSYQG